MSQSIQAPAQQKASSNTLSRVAFGVLAAATGLLIWGTGFDGRSFGPIRFLLVTTPYGDKVGHFVLYGAIAFALAILVRRPIPAAVGAMALVSIGIADEFRQRAVGGRNFDLLDIAANSVGICVGLLAAAMVTAFVVATPTRPTEASLLQR